MSIKALQDYTIYAKYAKYDTERKRRETWDEQADRVFEMHEKRFKGVLDTNANFRNDVQFAKQQLIKRRVLGSQRALQFGGESIEKHEAKMFNCIVSYCDRERFFQECMFLLLCGCGTGFSVQKHHIKELPFIQERTKGKKKFTIPDNIEGWADAIGIVVNSFFKDSTSFSEYNGYEVEFDFSEIREAGAFISGGFKAPGPDGLKNSINKIVELIETRIRTSEFLSSVDEFHNSPKIGDVKLRPIDAYDVIMHMSDAVLSGGVRRSATICVFSPDDSEMLHAKTGDWFTTNPQRGRSNNSVMLVRDKTTKEDFEKIMESVKDFGEPGFVWAEDEGVLYNPCLDGDTLIKTDVGDVVLREICKNPSKYKVLSQSEGGDLEYETVKAGIKTKENANTIKIEFDDDTCLELTPDHKVFTANRGYVKAANLTEDDEIVSVDFDGDSYESTEEVTEAGYVDQDKWVNRIIEQH
jgi:ribonucleoside-diphosphate reductase alpha chain